MSLLRHKLLNGGGVMIMKRWFGFLWRDHENFDNRIHKIEGEMQDLWEKLKVKNQERTALEKKKQQIIKSVGAATGKMKGLGEPFAGPSFTGFLKPDVDKPGQDWRPFVKLVKGVRTVGQGGKVSYSIEDAPHMDNVEPCRIPQSDRKRLEHGGNQGKGNQKQQGNQQGQRNQ